MCFSSWIGVLEDWQTLVSAGIALVAAFFTIKTMKTQMSQESVRHSKAVERKKLAVRAQLPNALSDLASHIRDRVARTLDGDSSTAEPPVGALSTLQTAIEFVDDSAANRLFELVSWYQVWAARLQSFNPNSDSDFDTAMYDSALLMFYATDLFEYGRNEEDEVSGDPPCADEMNRALRNSVGLRRFMQLEARFVNVLETIDRRHRIANDQA